MATNASRALRPVETGPRVLVHPRADRDLATSHWLLSTLPEDAWEGARQEWSRHGVAVLPLGTLFSAVRLPGHLVLAAAALTGRPSSADVDAFLNEVLDGGPVVCDPHNHRYYALVPGSMPDNWRAAAEEWQKLGVDCLGRDTYLGVPRVDVTAYEPQACASYWSVSMESAAMLCSPLDVARLIAAGAGALAKESEA